MATTISSKMNYGVDKKNTDNLVLVWLDSSVNNKENLSAQIQLRDIIADLHTFEDIPTCHEYIQSVPEEKQIVLIVSGRLGEELVPQIHQLASIIAIYVFCIDQAKYAIWAKNFQKIKAVIVDLDRLISIIELDHQIQIKAKNLLLPNMSSTKPKSDNAPMLLIGKDEEDAYYDDRCVFQFSLKDLVTAGELQYNKKTIKQVAIDIGDKFKSDPNRDYNALLLEALNPMMYLLKREQNLADFCGSLKSSLSKERDIPKLSQRLLVDTMMINSSRFLRQRLTHLLSKRNAVPMRQPPMGTTSQTYRFVSSIAYVWDYNRPILFSFGLGTCKGKTPLVNLLFDANFELSVKDAYFRGTIDVDFGYHFVERRSANVADVHGEIADEILKRFSKLFNGFLVHIESKSFIFNTSHIIETLKCLPEKTYVLLLIRDVDDNDDDAEVKTAQNSVHMIYPNCRFYYLPNIIDKTIPENVEKIDELRELIFHAVPELICHNEKYVQEQLKQLMDSAQLKNSQQDEVLLDNIRATLIDGTFDDCPLYTLFTRMCEIKTEIAKMDPYQANFQDKKLYDLQDILFQISAELKRKQQVGLAETGATFQLLLNLLQTNEERLNNLNLLSTELRRAQMKNKQNQLLSLEIHWRNAIICSKYLSDLQQQIFIDTYLEYINEGNPFEILDGDNFEMQDEFLTKVFQLFHKKKIFIISTIGQQNSGKSTLLNFLFGTLFEVREGRCTKGVYGTLVNINSQTGKHGLIPLDYDYILAIDTEGILSVEKGDEQYDKRLILFCLAVSHLVIVNTSGDISEILKKLLLLCTQSLNYLGTTRVAKPTIHFVLNQKADPNKENCKQQINIIRKDLEANGLTNLIDLGPDSFHVLSTAFNRKPFSDPNGECAALLTDITFVTNVQNLCEDLVGSSSEIIRRTGDCFSSPIKWIEFAKSILQVIKKYPDLTYFKEVFEREQYDKVRDYIRQTFREHLSREYASLLIEQTKEEDIDGIKEFFASEQTKMQKNLEDKLEEYIKNNALSENVRQRSTNFIQAQVTSLFRSWEVSVRIATARNKLSNIVHDGENRLRQLAQSKSNQNRRLDRDTAIKEFEMMWEDQFSKIEEQFHSEHQWKRSIESACRLYDVLDREALPTLDHVLNYLPFLISLHTSDQSIIAMNECLKKISEKCASNAAKTSPFVLHIVDEPKRIPFNDLLTEYDFFNGDELIKIYHNQKGDGPVRNRTAIAQGKRYDFSPQISSKWESMVRTSHCFEMLAKRIETILNSQNNDELSTDITLVQEILGAVYQLILDMNVEFRIFNFHVSKEFQSVLHVCAVISIALFYYTRYKKHFDEVISSLHKKKKSDLRDRFVRMVVIEDNDDENIAINLVKEFIEVLRQSFNLEVKEILDSQVKTNSAVLDRSFIIKKLDEEVDKASDDWLMDYILRPGELIIQHFNQHWDEIYTNIDQELRSTMNNYLKILVEFFRMMEEMNTILQLKTNHSLTFITDLFQLSGENADHKSSEKKICMATLLYEYFTEETSSTNITTKSGVTYTVDAIWTKMIHDFPKPSTELKAMFRKMKNIFEIYNISYLNVLLQKIIDQKENTENTFRDQIIDFIKCNVSSTKEQRLIRIRGCEASCPCCKRLCDVDHRLDNAFPVGVEENRHRCQVGHQIRAMGGIRYEISNEASIEWCENIKDEDPIIIKKGNRQRWKDFKNLHSNWDFGDPRIRDNQKTPYAHIWNRIGERLCQYHGNGMIFVKQNSPMLVNHFLLVLDHSGSMGSRKSLLRHMLRSSLQKTTTSVMVDSDNPTNLSPWEHLLKAVEEFIRVRNEKVCPSDRMTVIVFGSKAIRVYNGEKLNQIDINRINMTDCGGTTNFSAAFQAAIEILDEIQKDTTKNNLQQTIVFMTDGAPDVYPTNELEQLSTKHSSMIANFWTMGLGNYNKSVLEKVNTTMKGKLIDIKHPEDLPEAYAEIADFENTSL